MAAHRMFEKFRIPAPQKHAPHGSLRYGLELNVQGLALMAMPKAERRRAIEKLSRRRTLELLQWNDRNGVFSDKDLLAEGGKPYTIAEAHRKLFDVMAGR